MSNRRTVFSALLPAACLIVGMALAGCGAAGTAGNGPAGSKASSVPSPGPSAVSGAQAQALSTPEASASPWESFAGDFKTVEKNPLNEAIQYSLWLAANSKDEPDAQDTGASSVLKELAAKYQGAVAGKGVHYVEINDMVGMRTEYWIKGGKFKKADLELGQVTVFDGESYVQYDTDEKTGKRFTKEAMAADITLTTKGMLASLVASPYKQQKDAKVGKFTCAVFFMDIDLMGMKGSTLYVDKATGMLIKTQIGDPKDKKHSVSTTVQSFAVGGFGDEVFTVPKGITVKDSP